MTYNTLFAVNQSLEELSNLEVDFTTALRLTKLSLRDLTPQNSSIDDERVCAPKWAKEQT